MESLSGLSGLHAYVGFAIISVWGVVSGWALALSFMRYEETPGFWRAVSLAQVLLGIQLLFGLGLFVGRGFAQIGVEGWFSTIFHPLYGFVFPLVVLFFAHAQARKPERSSHRVFALAAFVIFGLTARAFMVGSGIG
jgi:hypothetical protein